MYAILLPPHNNAMVCIHIHEPITYCIIVYIYRQKKKMRPTTYQEVDAVGAQKSDGGRAEQSENETSVFVSVGHR